MNEKLILAHRGKFRAHPLQSYLSWGVLQPLCWIRVAKDSSGFWWHSTGTQMSKTKDLKQEITIFNSRENPRLFVGQDMSIMHDWIKSRSCKKENRLKCVVGIFAFGFVFFFFFSECDLSFHQRFWTLPFPCVKRHILPIFIHIQTVINRWSN